MPTKKINIWSDANEQPLRPGPYLRDYSETDEWLAKDTNNVDYFDGRKWFGTWEDARFIKLPVRGPASKYQSLPWRVPA